MDFTRYTKKLRVPDGFAPPVRLVHGELVALPLTRGDLDDDLCAIRSSVEIIRRTRGGRAGWPPDDLSEADDLDDLVWHEVEWRDRKSFAYVVRDLAGAYVGCVYLYPLGGRTELSETMLEYDVDVSWWVSADAYARGAYERLYDAIGVWLASEFPFWKPYLSNREIPRTAAPGA